MNQPETSNLYQLFHSRFESVAYKSFLQLDDGRQISFSEIDRLSAKYAGKLTSLGIGPTDRVLAQIGKSHFAVALYLACLRIGAVYIPLNTAYTESELDYFMQDAQPSAFFYSSTGKGRLSVLATKNDIEHCLSLDVDGTGSFDELRAPAREELATQDSNAIAAMLYTSGTTGQPKGAMLSIGNLASNALSLHQIWGWQEEDVLLHALPIFHIHGLFVALHCALLNASTVLFHQKFDVTRIRSALPNATVLMGVPTFYTRLLADEDFGQEDCRQIRLFISGSAPLLAATFEEFERRTGHRILERYGMTETGMICSNPLDGDRLPGTVGYPLPDLAVRVCDENGALLPANQIGTIEVSGPNVFKGYWRKPEKTKEEIREDGFFITGDLGNLSEDGRLTIVGRGKDLIISGGYNIYPKEIENQIDQIEGVSESAVIGVPDADYGESVIAIIVPEANSAIQEQDIQNTLKSKLARFKQPQRILFVTELPRNTMGKVEKNRLRQQFQP